MEDRPYFFLSCSHDMYFISKIIKQKAHQNISSNEKDTTFVMSKYLNPILFLTYFREFSFTFRTSDFHFALTFWDSYFLLAFRAAINIMCLSLLEVAGFILPASRDLVP